MLKRFALILAITLCLASFIGALLVSLSATETLTKWVRVDSVWQIETARWGCLAIAILLMAINILTALSIDKVNKDLYKIQFENYEVFSFVNEKLFCPIGQIFCLIFLHYHIILFHSSLITCIRLVFIYGEYCKTSSRK
jgi:hypothetical protein